MSPKLEDGLYYLAIVCIWTLALCIFVYVLHDAGVL